MDVIILIFFVLLIATLLLGIWQIKNPKLKTADDLSDDLCLYVLWMMAKKEPTASQMDI